MARTPETLRLSDAPDRQHLLRRLTFAPTVDLEGSISSRSAPDGFNQLLKASQETSLPDTPSAVSKPWVNRALRFADMSQDEANAASSQASQANQRDAAELREWWLRELISGPAPLRENVVLFLHSVLGGSHRTIDPPHALYGYNVLLRRSWTGTIPDLLEALALDPGMIIQEGYDESRRELPSDFSARQILNKWTIGPGIYTDDDAYDLARALTGWVLEAAPGEAPARAVDPRGSRANRRTGLIPTFHPELADTEPKTILGETRNFGARDAVRYLATKDATAQRWASLMIAYFGVADPRNKLRARVAASYKDTQGSIPAMLRTLVLSEEFWSDDSRWNLIKSPVHLSVGACRQLGLREVPAGLDDWLGRSGQRLLDAPDSGLDGWPGQDAWLDPPDQLSARYELGDVLAKAAPADRIAGLNLRTPESQVA